MVEGGGAISSLRHRAGSQRFLPSTPSISAPLPWEEEIMFTFMFLKQHGGVSRTQWPSINMCVSVCVFMKEKFR